MDTSKTAGANQLAGNLRYMFRSIRQYDRKLLLIMLSPVAAQLAAAVLGIFLPKYIIDSLQSHIPLGHLLTMIAVLAAALAAAELLRRWGEDQTLIRSMSHRIMLSSRINDKTLTTDYENVSSKAGRDRWEKAMAAVNANESGTEALIRQAISFIRNACGFLLYGAILAALNPVIVALLLAGSALTFLAARQAISYEHRHKDETAALETKLYYLREQSVEAANAKDIRLYSMAGWFANLFGQFIAQRHGWNRRIQGRYYISNAVDAAVVLLRDGLAYAYLIHQVLHGLPVGDFVLFFGAITGFSLWLSGMADDGGQIHRSCLQVGDLREYLDMPDRSNRGPGRPLPQGPAPPSLELRDVCFGYPQSGVRLFEHMNLTIASGEKLAIVGTNGAGKTTLIKLLTGLLRPDEGEVLLDGVPMDGYNIHDYQRMFSVAFQDACILSFTLAENVSMEPLDSTDMDRVDRALSLAGLKDKADSLPGGPGTYLNNIFTDHGIELSGGERQKLILARALYKDAPILILDEPTAALDPIAESRLYDEYARMARRKTSVYISHRLASTRFCDRILFLEDGSIAETGTHEELMALGGKYAHMFAVQSHYYQDQPEVNP